MPLDYIYDGGISWTQLQIKIFQLWYWHDKEDEPLVSGTKGDKCTAKYKSALCGGKACINPQAVDGKLGPSTKSLITKSNVEEFTKWLNKNRTTANEYMNTPLVKCSSADKGYVSGGGSQTGGRSSTGGGGGSTGGGGGSTGGGGTGAHELSGLV
jgi:uncharacterized membrane protein YgcG